MMPTESQIIATTTASETSPFQVMPTPTPTPTSQRDVLSPSSTTSTPITASFTSRSPPTFSHLSSFSLSVPAGKPSLTTESTTGIEVSFSSTTDSTYLTVSTSGEVGTTSMSDTAFSPHLQTTGTYVTITRPTNPDTSTVGTPPLHTMSNIGAGSTKTIGMGSAAVPYASTLAFMTSLSSYSSLTYGTNLQHSSDSSSSIVSSILPSRVTNAPEISATVESTHANSSQQALLQATILRLRDENSDLESQVTGLSVATGILAALVVVLVVLFGLYMWIRMRRKKTRAHKNYMNNIETHERAESQKTTTYFRPQSSYDMLDTGRGSSVLYIKSNTSDSTDDGGFVSFSSPQSRKGQGTVAPASLEPCIIEEKEGGRVNETEVNSKLADSTFGSRKKGEINGNTCELDHEETDGLQEGDFVEVELRN
ncbi:mucin-5AC [Aplysia californica]|uniref:Mucin-5AC n=1 Tax=Aplysia californica TaxID=6500 RepID=A0ABM0JJC6_APLCA|nr:mucin-5AC [Aplysia californica]